MPHTPALYSALEQSALGKTSASPDRYDPRLLFPIARMHQRASLGITDTLPFCGADLWTAFELSWLNLRGKPQIAIAHISVPCETPNIIESKSLKLYLGSFNHSRFANVQAVRECICQDLSEAAWRGSAGTASRVGVSVLEPQHFAQERIEELSGVLLDRLDVQCSDYNAPAPEQLAADHSVAPVSEVLVSHLLRSNCPVTGQPDWGSVQISYSGAPIDQAALLQYVVSFRRHSEFHEHCVERIFMDVWTRCRPFKLAVYARYSRRGGLDINPLRTSGPQSLPRNVRTARQ